MKAATFLFLNRYAMFLLSIDPEKKNPSINVEKFSIGTNGEVVNKMFFFSD
jgi:hypothetical protein